nr:uncharacterized protein LOC109743997 [Aegilops tauschii subsp. strangulata]
MADTASGSKHVVSDLEAIMEELGLTEDNLQDVVIEDEELPAEATRGWQSLGFILKNPTVNTGDWEHVMEEGPWQFKGKAVVLAPYDGFTKPSTIELKTIDIWMQIHDLPDSFFSKIKALSSTIGEFIYAEPKSHDFEGNFARVRLRIDVTKPLKNAVSLVIRKKDALERVIFRVKYERLPDWCAVCGYLGHLFKECGDGVHAPKALVFKDLRATWFRGPGRGPGEGRGDANAGGTRGGRGRGRAGRGRGHGFTGQNYTDNTAETDGEKHQDIAMFNADKNRKRGSIEASPPALATPGATTNVANQLLLLPSTSSPSEVPHSPPPKQEPKRNKTTSVNDKNSGETPNAPKNNDARVAGPLGGSRQAQ